MPPLKNRETGRSRKQSVFFVPYPVLERLQSPHVVTQRCDDFVTW